jgi:predicted kinase
MAALVHLICGSTGAGKSTYARKLTEELGAVRFSIDEWMTALYWMDSPQPIDADWAMQRVERCVAQIWATAREVAERGLPCVFDLGFSSHDMRKRFVDRAASDGFTSKLHFLDIAPDERWRRVEIRNQQGGDLTFAVTRDMFDYVESLWQPPSDQEMAAHDGVRVW